MSNAKSSCFVSQVAPHLKGSTTWADPDGWMIPTCR
jgi:hypothetical protein